MKTTAGSSKLELCLFLPRIHNIPLLREFLVKQMMSNNSVQQLEGHQSDFFQL